MPIPPASTVGTAAPQADSPKPAPKFEPNAPVAKRSAGANASPEKPPGNFVKRSDVRNVKLGDLPAHLQGVPLGQPVLVKNKRTGEERIIRAVADGPSPAPSKKS
jgi:hypothetical protein